MEIPYDIITSTDFTSSPSSQGQGRASFILSQPPNFYMEAISSPAPGVPTSKIWKRCSDWTQGMQATTVLRHDVVGSAIQLIHTIKGLGGAGSSVNSSTNIQLHPPGYAPIRSPSLDVPLPVQIPPPPMMGIPVSQNFSFPNLAVQQLRPLHVMHGRKRSFSGPAAFDSSLLPDLPSHSQSSEAVTLAAAAPRFLPTHRANSLQFLGGADFSGRNLPSYQMSPPQSLLSQPQQSQQQQQQVHQQSHSLDEFSSVPISHAVVQRPYTASPLGSRSFNDDRQLNPQRRFSELTSGSSTLSTLSQPLLTTPFTPGMSGSAPPPILDVMPNLQQSVLDELDLGYSYINEESVLNASSTSVHSASTGDLGSSLEGAIGGSVDASLRGQHPTLD